MEPSSHSTAASTADFVKSEPVHPLRRWPEMIVAFGLGLTAAWACLLAYGLIRLIERAV